MSINNINSHYNPVEILRQSTTQPITKQNPLDIPERNFAKESLSLLKDKITKPLDRNKSGLSYLADISKSRINEAMVKDGPNKNPINQKKPNIDIFA